MPRKALKNNATVERAMASQSQGIQQLLTAEKRAAEKVADARKRKTKRIKQARQEAQAEIDKYKSERDKTFKDFETKHLGCRETVAARIDEDTEVKKAQIAIDVKNNKEKVISELLDLVCNIDLQVHKNYFVINPKK